MNGAYYFSLGSHKGCILLRMYIKFTKCMLLINWHQSENEVELQFVFHSGRGQHRSIEGQIERTVMFYFIYGVFSL